MTVIDQAADPRTESQDISARLQERIKTFTAFYEQHAYVAYNVALRIACESDGAIRAAQLGFLRQVGERPAGLLPAVVDAALEAAPSQPDPAAAGDTESERHLAAMAELAPPERAALALADLAHAGPEAIATSLDLPEEQAAKLLHRAREGFAARLGLPRPQADEASRDWMWAAPPPVIWEELYPEFHRTAERDLRRRSGEQTLILAPETSSAPHADAASRRRRRRLRAAATRLQWRPRRRWVVAAGAILVLGAAGAAAQLLGPGATGKPGGSSGQSAGSGAGPALPGTGSTSPDATGASVQTHKPLTPAELDKLRLQELDRLNRFTRQQANKRLPASKRQAAARGIDALQHKADRRMSAELKREQRLRDALARERAKAKAPPPPPSPSAPRRTTSTPSRTQAPQRQTTSPKPSSPSSEQANCLLDQDTGQYICPQ